MLPCLINVSFALHWSGSLHLASWAAGKAGALSGLLSLGSSFIDLLSMLFEQELSSTRGGGP
jgi:hypothetical protein